MSFWSLEEIHGAVHASFFEMMHELIDSTYCICPVESRRQVEIVLCGVTIILVLIVRYMYLNSSIDVLTLRNNNTIL